MPGRVGQIAKLLLVAVAIRAPAPSIALRHLNESVHETSAFSPWISSHLTCSWRRPCRAASVIHLCFCLTTVDAPRRGLIGWGLEAPARRGLFRKPRRAHWLRPRQADLTQGQRGCPLRGWEADQFQVGWSSILGSRAIPLGQRIAGASVPVGIRVPRQKSVSPAIMAGQGAGGITSRIVSPCSAGGLPRRVAGSGQAPRSPEPRHLHLTPAGLSTCGQA